MDSSRDRAPSFSRYVAQHASGVNQCTCIIPFYNERNRILRVLNVATRLSRVTQVICVDDGSTDGAAALVARHHPNVTLVRQPHNTGKAAAVQAGASLTTSSHVLLLDADLRDLRAAEVNLAVATALANPAIDMIILRRVRAALPAHLSRGDVLFSGERILKTVDLATALVGNPSRYQIEIAINHYMMRRRKQVYWMPSSARNTLKIEKSGLVRGLAGDLTMLENMIDFAGLGAFLQQYLFFAREELPPVGAPVEGDGYRGLAPSA